MEVDVFGSLDFGEKEIFLKDRDGQNCYPMCRVLGVKKRHGKREG